MVPSKFVDRAGVYAASERLKNQIKCMWRHRNPRQIGLVTEAIAKEIINGGELRVGKKSGRLICESMRDLSCHGV
jgi:hypothetical protein